ncbi:putative alpha/beta hydrolase [Sesbania bispinosa]|nr:putative alpha/beta hydrolase [Sesbania bispinosa]
MVMYYSEVKSRLSDQSREEYPIYRTPKPSQSLNVGEACCGNHDTYPRTFETGLNNQENGPHSKKMLTAEERKQGEDMAMKIGGHHSVLLTAM